MKNKQLDDGRHGNHSVFKTVVRRRLRRRGWVRFPCASAIWFKGLRQLLDAVSLQLRLSPSPESAPPVTWGRSQEAPAPERFQGILLLSSSGIVVHPEVLFAGDVSDPGRE